MSSVGWYNFNRFQTDRQDRRFEKLSPLITSKGLEARIEFNHVKLLLLPHHHVGILNMSPRKDPVIGHSNSLPNFDQIIKPHICGLHKTTTIQIIGEKLQFRENVQKASKRIYRFRNWSSVSIETGIQKELQKGA